jgi:hypothetical protein
MAVERQCRTVNADKILSVPSPSQQASISQASMPRQEYSPTRVIVRQEHKFKPAHRNGDMYRLIHRIHVFTIRSGTTLREINIISSVPRGETDTIVVNQVNH